MKAIEVLKLAGGAILVAASLHTNAQTAQPDPSTATPGTTASPAATTKQQAAQTRAERRAANAANRRLSRQVRSALARDGHISVANITVRARNGAVTLQGSVPEVGQIDRATQAAKGVAGVTSVKNALSIRSVGT